MKDHIKLAVLHHIKNLMKDEMTKDLPSMKNMHVVAEHSEPPTTKVLAGHDEKGHPVEGVEHEEQHEALGMVPHNIDHEIDEPEGLPDLSSLNAMKDESPAMPEMASAMDEPKAEHPLFSGKPKKSKAEMDEDMNHSKIAMLKRMKKSKE